MAAWLGFLVAPFVQGPLDTSACSFLLDQVDPAAELGFENLKVSHIPSLLATEVAATESKPQANRQVLSARGWCILDFGFHTWYLPSGAIKPLLLIVDYENTIPTTTLLLASLPLVSSSQVSQLDRLLSQRGAKRLQQLFRACGTPYNVACTRV